MGFPGVLWQGKNTQEPENMTVHLETRWIHWYSMPRLPLSAA